MHSIIIAMVIILVFSVPLALSAERPTCAVLTFDAGEGITVGEAKFISDRFAALLTQLGKYDVVARSRMHEILKVAEFNRADHCSATDCAVEAGKILQVKYMIFGSVGHIEDLYSLNTSLVEVETGKITNTAITDYRGRLADFVQASPGDNLKSLLMVKQTPKDWTSLSEKQNRLHKRTDQEWDTSPKPIPSVGVPRHPIQKPNWYFGPRLGYSSFTGLAGVEIQRNHLALNAGVQDKSILGGLKYYFNPCKGSWSIGLGGGGGTTDERYGGDKTEEYVVGAIGGYRWRWRTRYDLNLGLGLGYREETQTTMRGVSTYEADPTNPGYGWYTPTGKTVEEKEKESGIVPMFEATIGYSF